MSQELNIDKITTSVHSQLENLYPNTLRSVFEKFGHTSVKCSKYSLQIEYRNKNLYLIENMFEEWRIENLENIFEELPLYTLNKVFDLIKELEK